MLSRELTAWVLLGLACGHVVADLPPNVNGVFCHQDYPGGMPFLSCPNGTVIQTFKAHYVDVLPFTCADVYNVQNNFTTAAQGGAYGFVASHCDGFSSCSVWNQYPEVGYGRLPANWIATWTCSSTLPVYGSTNENMYCFSGDRSSLDTEIMDCSASPNTTVSVKYVNWGWPYGTCGNPSVDPTASADLSFLGTSQGTDYYTKNVVNVCRGTKKCLWGNDNDVAKGPYPRNQGGWNMPKWTQFAYTCTAISPGASWVLSNATLPVFTMGGITAVFRDSVLVQSAFVSSDGKTSPGAYSTSPYLYNLTTQTIAPLNLSSSAKSAYSGIQSRFPTFWSTTDGQLYFFGGEGTSSLNFFRLSIATQTLRTLALPFNFAPSRGNPAVSVGSMAYILDQVAGDLWKFDPAITSVDPVVDSLAPLTLPSNYELSRMVQYNGSLWLTGGNSTNFTQFFKYDLQARLWSPWLVNMPYTAPSPNYIDAPYAFNGHVAVMWRSILLLGFGEWNQWRVNNNLFYIDMCEPVHSMRSLPVTGYRPMGRANAHFWVQNDSLYVAGGSRNWVTGLMNDVWSLDLTRLQLPLCACSAGQEYSAVTATCKACQTGFVQPDSGYNRVCSQCAAGQTSSDGVTCLAIPPATITLSNTLTLAPVVSLPTLASDILLASRPAEVAVTILPDSALSSSVFGVISSSQVVGRPLVTLLSQEDSGALSSISPTLKVTAALVAVFAIGVVLAGAYFYHRQKRVKAGVAALPVIQNTASTTATGVTHGSTEVSTAYLRGGFDISTRIVVPARRKGTNVSTQMSNNFTMTATLGSTIGTKSAISYPAFLELPMTKNNFRLVRALGEGGSAAVSLFAVMDPELSGKWKTSMVAIKQFFVSEAAQSTPAADQLAAETITDKMAEFQNEAGITFSLQHSENIVRLFACCRDPMCLILQNYPLSLNDFLYKKSRAVYQKVPLGTIVGFAHDMMSGLDSMASMGLAHLDLKPGNMLLEDVPVTANPKTHSPFRLVLSDFGLTKQLTNDHAIRGRKVVNNRGLSYSYAAPEYFSIFYNGLTVEPEVYFKIDIYALCMTLQEVICHERPWMGSTMEETNELVVLRKKRPAFAPAWQLDDAEYGPAVALFHNIIERGTVQDHQDRPAISTLLKELSASLGS